MSNDEIAQAVGDEVDLLDTFKMANNSVEFLGVLTDAGLRGGIGHIVDHVLSVLLEKRRHRFHGRRATTQAMQADHGLAGVRFEFLLFLDLVQLRTALGEAAPGVPHVLAVEQPAMAGHHVTLNVPIAQEQFVGPKLRPAARGRLKVEQPGGRLVFSRLGRFRGRSGDHARGDQAGRQSGREIENSWHDDPVGFGSRRVSSRYRAKS